MMTPLDRFKQKVNAFFQNVPKSIPHIPFDKIPPKSKYILPSGGYGEAYLTDDKKKAVKIIHLSKQIDDRILFSLQNEIVHYHAVSTLCPKYFCKFIGYSYDEASFVAVIVMENCGTDFLEYYNTEINEKFQMRFKSAQYNENMMMKIEIEKTQMLKLIFFKVLEAIDCLHQNGYAHLDIKPENIVILDNNVKFIDAGSLTKIRPGSKTHVFGTENYMAPELFRSTTVNCDDNLKKLDIYSFGKMVVHVLTTKEIFCMFSGDTIVQDMLDKDPDNRPSVRDVMVYMHPGLVVKRKRKDSKEAVSPNKTGRKRILPKSKSKSKSKTLKRAKTYG